MKNIIESVLVTHLGKYIDGLKNSLDIGLLDGEVTIENVSLKPSFVNQLGLPFTLKFSHIEKIHINIPWTSLKEKNTIVKVQGIYVLLNISYQEVDETVDPTELLRSMMERIKMEMKKKWNDGSKEETFAQKNLIRIVDNVVVSVNNIHVRLESYCRNWDYSFGVIMDGITSYTVDQNEQKYFYTRHFSHKEQNLPFKKLLNIDKLQLYFNDTENVFISDHANKNKARHYLIRMMAHPFPNHSPSSPKKPRPQQLQPYPPYSIKNLTTIRLSAVGSQRFASDMRYVVQVNVIINSIDIKMNSRQLSQIFHCIQHFYDYGLNIIKNGRKGYDFDESRQKAYRLIIAKLAKEEKLTPQQNSALLAILAEVPVSVLENINDEVINSVRFDKEMKKITEVRNAEKSKKMMQQLLDKKQKMQAMEGIQIFKEVLIDLKIYRVNLAICDAQERTVAEFGMLGVSLNVHMDLTGQIKIILDIKNAIVMAVGSEISIDHFDPVHSLVMMDTVITKGEVTALKVRLLKKQLRLSEQVICSILGWLSLIRLKPSLLNYAAEQINYSIDITRVMMGFLCSPKRHILFEIAMPLIKLQLPNSVLSVDMGRLVGQSQLNNSQFTLNLSHPLLVNLNEELLLQLKACLIRMQSRTDKSLFEQISISLSNLQVPNPQSFIKKAFQFEQGQLISYWKALEVADHSADQLLQGCFFLNKLKGKLRAKISQSQLVFFSQERSDFPQQKISLTRTRVYRLAVEGRWFIVFKQQVQKQVNIVEAGGEKPMKTLFLKLKDYIQEISTAFQWQKYYQQLYKQDISTLEEIQDVNLSNNILMILNVECQVIRVTLAPDASLALKGLQAAITYNQFNTEAELGLGGLDLNINQEMVISETSLKGKYESLQSKMAVLQVNKLNYQVRLFSTFSRIIAIGADYQLMAMSLRTQHPPKTVPAVQEDQLRLANIKSQSIRSDNLNKFLLQFKVTVSLAHVDGEILQYRNRLRKVHLQVWKNRNQPHLSLTADLHQMLLFSMVDIPSLTLAFTPTQITLSVDSINSEVDLQTIIYEVVRGEGSLILKEVIKSIRDNKIAKAQLREEREKAMKNKEETVAGRRLNLHGRMGEIRIEIKVTGQLSLGISSKALELVNGRFSWSEALFWLNGQCISLVENNGILKWGYNTVDLCMTNFKLKLNSKQILFLIYQINKIQKFFRNNKFNAIAFVHQEFSNPDEQGRVAQQSHISFAIRIEQLQLVYECGDRNPLLSVRLRPLFLINEAQTNSLNISVWHLNRQLKLYQPVVEPLELRVMQRKESKQFELSLEQAYIIISKQCLSDCLDEVRHLQQIQTQLAADESVELEEMTPQEISRIKSGMADPAFQWYLAPHFHQNIQYNFVLKVNNLLGCSAIAEIFCGKKQRQCIHFKEEEAETKIIRIPQRTSYQHSYQLIERYEKVQLKVGFLNQFYSARATTASFLLYDRDNHYIRPVTFVDANGIEIASRVAVKVTYAEGGYQVQLIGKYAIQSQVPLPLYFRYADACSINKKTLFNKQSLLLPPWTVDYVTFGVHEEEYDHVLRLSPQEGQEETEGCHILSVRYTENSRVQLIIQKTAINQIAKQTPKLNYLKHDDPNAEPKRDERQAEQEKEKKEEKPQLTIYNFKIIPGIMLVNHFNFPITVNEQTYEPKQPKQLLEIYLDKGREFIRLSLGDRSNHQIYVPAVNQPTPLSLRVTDDNYVTFCMQVRRNILQQRIMHIYAEVHLMINIPSLHPPTLVTNIYQHHFIVKKQVKNSHSDRPHPPPILKDKFTFNTAHFLLSLEEKYMLLKLNACTSNEFILFHSDFDCDLQLTSDLSGQPEAVYAVSYACETVLLQTDEEGRKAELLQCFTTHLLPKYYIINRSQESFVVNGAQLVRPGEKVTINNVKFLDLNVRDQLDFKYMHTSVDTATYILFVRGTEKPYSQDNISNRSDIDSNERATEVNRRFDGLAAMAEVTEVTEQPSTGRRELDESQSILQQNKQQKRQQSLLQEGQVGLMRSATHVITMQDVQIFAVSRRPCSYNTVCYQLNGWSQWLSVTNKLNHPLFLRIRLQEGIVGVQRVLPGNTGRIIADISPFVQFALQTEVGEVILGQFQLDQRLNNTIYLTHCGYNEIVLKESKARVGREVTVQSLEGDRQEPIQKVEQSFKVKIGKIRISLVFMQDKMRRELVRLSLSGLNLLAMRYKNGLYMLHLQFDCLNAIYKRVSFLLLQAISGYLQGVEGEFIQRITLDLGPLLEITLTDELIVSLIAQIEGLQRFFPAKSSEEAASLQEEQTFHINSLGVRGVEIRLCMRKRISEMTEQKSRLLSKMGLSIVEVQDAHIHLSPVEITTPLRQKHLNGISKMYTMESFVGVASGLNILGNPSQFVNQFQAGRNRGGVVPFFRSIVAGTSNSLSKIIGTIGSGVSELTFDRQFMKHRIDNKNIKADSFGMGLKIGLRELAHSVKSGIVGVVEQPLQGHREEGGMGALKGMLAGITGLLTKPLTGLIFAASKTIEGVNSSVTYLDPKQLQNQELITRPLYHKFKLVRPYRAEDELAYNILLNWWEYGQVELVGAYLLQNEEGDSVADILIITCSQLILIDLDSKEVKLKLRTEELMATGKFSEGVVLYYQDGQSEEDQDQIVFRLQNDSLARDNLYWTLKGFIGLYAQKES